jgi:hypothetical protein
VASNRLSGRLVEKEQEKAGRSRAAAAACQVFRSHPA